MKRDYLKWTLTFLGLGLILVNGVGASTSSYLKIKCPVEGTEFQVVEAGSTTTIGQKADLSLIGAIGPFYNGHVHSCPKCHFSGTREDFRQSLSESFKQKIRKEFVSYLPGVKLSDLAEIDLTLQIYEWQNRPPLDFIEVALVGSYLSEGSIIPYYQFYQNDYKIETTVELPSKKRRFYQAMTALNIEKSWKQNLFEEKDKAIYAYLAGEMNRRCANFIQAEIWFCRALDADTGQEQDKFHQMILRQQKFSRAHNNDDTL